MAKTFVNPIVNPIGAGHLEDLAQNLGANEKITLTRNGIWLSNGSEITHSETVKTFFRSIHKDDREYFLKIGPEEKRIEVEATSYFVTSITGDPTRGYEMTLSNGALEPLNLESLHYEAPDLLTCILQNSERARFLHAPYHLLLSNIILDGTGDYCLTVCNKRIKLK